MEGWSWARGDRNRTALRLASLMLQFCAGFLATLGKPSRVAHMDLGDVELVSRNGSKDLQVAWYKGGRALLSLKIGEVVALLGRSTLWELSGDDEGECYLGNGEDVQWASEALQEPLFEDPATKRLCIVRQGKQIMLEDLVAQRLPSSEASYTVGGVGVVCLQTFGWQCGRGGSKLWWNALRVHKALNLKSHKCDSGRWAEHGWARWEKAVVEDQMLATKAWPVGTPRCAYTPTWRCRSQVLVVGAGWVGLAWFKQCNIDLSPYRLSSAH